MSHMTCKQYTLQIVTAVNMISMYEHLRVTGTLKDKAQYNNWPLELCMDFTMA